MQHLVKLLFPGIWCSYSKNITFLKGKHQSFYFYKTLKSQMQFHFLYLIWIDLQGRLTYLPSTVVQLWYGWLSFHPKEQWCLSLESIPPCSTLPSTTDTLVYFPEKNLIVSSKKEKKHNKEKNEFLIFSPKCKH